MKRHLLKNIERVKELAGSKRISLFLDYDGTLTPIVARPEVATLSFQVKEILRKLVRLYPTAVITGRGLEDIRERVPIGGLVYAANHGMEVWSTGFTMVFDAGRDVGAELKKLLAAFNGLVKKFKGVIVEDKGATLSVHYRLLDIKEVKAFKAALRELAAPSVEKGLVKLTEGKKVFELRPPVSWNKGRVVEWIMQRDGFSGTFPLYVGDDETDRDGFRAVKGKGLSVFVGGMDDEADFYLNSQDEVRPFLEWLRGR
ncbi:MAG: trehalose-phosphatase [Thermodesulfobacteriota bacterium]